MHFFTGNPAFFGVMWRSVARHLLPSMFDIIPGYRFPPFLQLIVILRGPNLSSVCDGKIMRINIPPPFQKKSCPIPGFKLIAAYSGLLCVISPVSGSTNWYLVSESFPNAFFMM